MQRHHCVQMMRASRHVARSSSVSTPQLLLHPRPHCCCCYSSIQILTAHVKLSTACHSIRQPQYQQRHKPSHTPILHCTSISRVQYFTTITTTAAAASPLQQSSAQSPSSFLHTRYSLAALIGLTVASLLSQHADAETSSAAATHSSSQPVGLLRPHPVTIPLPAGVNDFELSQIASLRVRLESLASSVAPTECAYLHRWCIHDSNLLLRYLRAHKHCIDSALNGILATAKWRVDEDIDSISFAEFADHNKVSLMYVVRATDSDGRAIIFNRKSPLPNASWGAAGEERDRMYRKEMRFLVYTMERAAREMEERAIAGAAAGAAATANANTSTDSATATSSAPSSSSSSSPHSLYPHLDHKWVFIVDLHAYNNDSATPWHITRSLVDVMRLHYPERLHRAIIIDAPWYLRKLCALLRPFIDKVTRDKVLFVSDRHSPATRKIIEDTLGDIARLPIETNIDGAKTKFDYEAYVRDDPFVHPMRAALRNAGLLHGTTTEAANVQTEAETSVSDKGAAAPTLTTSRWRFW